MRLLCMDVPSKMVRLGLSQIDLIIQILLFPLRVPRFLRDTLLPLADGADGAERYMGLTQIDLIIQILLFPLRVPRFLRETPLPLADCADAAERRRKGNCETRCDVMRSM